MKYLPSALAHPGGLHAYSLTKYIVEPTLLIAKKEDVEWLPLPSHARAKAIAYRDVVFASRIVDGFRRDGQGSWRRRIAIAARVILKTGELSFFTQSLPALVRFKPDVVHAHGVINVLAGVFAKRLLSSRFVLTIHGATEVAIVKRSRLLRRCLRDADKIICVSQPLRDELAECVAAEKLEVIAPAVDRQIFADRGRVRRNQLIAVGHFKWQKGYPYLIEAVARVFTRFPDYQLLLIGDGPERAAIEEQIGRAGLSDRVVLPGVLSQPRIADHLNESRVFVMSSLSEGLPKALLEAVACGTPAVVTTACNASDIIDRVGVAVPPRDPMALAAAIEDLLADHERWHRLSRTCAEIADDYDWKAIAARTVKLYAASS